MASRAEPQPATLTTTQAAAAQQSGAQPKTISLPGWQDIISIPNGPPPTKDQLKQYHDAKKKGQPSGLPQDVIDEIERRAGIRDRIKSSSAPAEAGKWGRILTWLDDTQDLFSIISIGGRIAARLAPKILGRLIPGLGWVLLAADILKLLTMLSSLIQPFFVGMCSGWTKGVAGAIPALAMGNAAKLIGHGFHSLNPFSRSAQLARQAKFAGKLFRVGELLELAQAMKTVTGYGLTLGGIIGTMQETAYAVELWLRGERINIRIPGSSGAQISLSDGSIYAPGNAKSLATIYDKLGSMMKNPADKANATEHARQLRALGM